MKKILFLLFVFISAEVYAQDSTISRAFKSTQPKRNYPLIKAKYPSYQLLTGFLLVKEANNGDPYAQHELGLRYLLGKGFTPDTSLALKWIKRAVEQNLVFARFNYGIMLNNGIGLDWDPFKAYLEFKYTAETGLPAGQYVYGIFLTDNLVVNRSLTKAYKWVKKGADGGFDPAKKALEQFRNSGFSFALDSTDSEGSSEVSNEFQSINESTSLIEHDWELDLFEFDDDSVSESAEIEAVKKILNQNTDKLKEILGISEKVKSSELKDTSAVGLINLAANSGSPEALLIAGRGFERGIVVQENRISAAMNYLRALRLGSRKAAENLYNLTKTENFFENLKTNIDSGNANAMYVWAGLVALGFDYSITSEQAFDLLIKAGNENHIHSIVETGLCYYNGNLVDKDKVKASEFWEKAAKLGSTEAKVRLAFSKISEYDGISDISNEIEVLQESSKEGSVLAQSALAYCYEQGVGVLKDKPQAVGLYRKAAYRGNMAAYNSLRRMYDEIRPDDEEFVIYTE